MKKLNDTMDIQIYLKHGKLTKPFLTDDELKSELERVKNALLKEGKPAEIEDCLLAFVHEKIKMSEDQNFIKANKYSRTAGEIFKNGVSTGCTDFAYVFATLCRQLNIPTTLLQTAQKEWVNKYVNQLASDDPNKDYRMHHGHSFCECYIHGKWVLVDPTSCIIDWKYDSTMPIHLNDYKIDESMDYLPYFRGTDLKEKQTLKQFTNNEEIAVRLKFGKTFSYKNVVDQFHKIKNPEELKTFMDTILTYGYIDTDGVEHTATMRGIENHKVLSVEDILLYKYETCAEAAKLAKYWLSTNGYECKLFFERIKRHEHETGEYFNHSTHFYILFNDHKNGWCRFEQSSTDNAGITEYGTFDKAIKHVIEDVELTRQNQIDFNKGRDVDFDTYGIYQFDDIPNDWTYKIIDKKADELDSVLNEESKQIEKIKSA